MAASLVGRKKSDPFPPIRRQNAENLGFSREIDPSPPTLLVGGGGGRVRKCLTFALFWPSANWPLWRKGSVRSISRQANGINSHPMAHCSVAPQHKRRACS